MNSDIQKTNNTLTALMRGCFYAGIFFLPISIALVETFSGFVVLFFVIKRGLAFGNTGKTRMDLWPRLCHAAAPYPGYLNPFLMLLTIAVLLSVVFSEYTATSWLSFFAKFLEGIFLYAGFLEAFDRQEDINHFVWVWFGSAFLTGISGLSQFFGGIDFLRMTPLTSGRVSSSLRHANDFGAYISAVIPVLAVIIFKPRITLRTFMHNESRLIKGPVFIRIFLIAAFLVLLVCLGLTFSRGAWVGVFTAALLLGLQKRKRMFTTIFAIIVFLVIFTPFMVKARDVSLITDNVRDKKEALTESVREHGFFSKEYWNTVSTYSFQHLGMGRVKYWHEAMGILCDHPLFGSGLNTYSKTAPGYKVSWGGYPHNSYLQMAAELGLVGLGAFLWMLWNFFKTAFTSLARKAPANLPRVMLLGVLAGLLAFLVQSFFDTTFYSVQLGNLMWIILGLAMALKRQIDKS